MLDFRTFKTKRRGISVHLYRKYQYADENNGNQKFSYKQIGTFLLNEGYSSEIVELLEPDEVMQLKNWLFDAHFAEKFHVELSELSKETVRIPSVFLTALIKLDAEAKRLGINFIPHKVMLDALLRSALLLQNKIDQINGFKSEVLESSGLQIEQVPKKEEREKFQDKEAQILFKKLLELGEPVPKICEELEVAAQKYGNNKRITVSLLKEWAADLRMRPPNKRIRKWHYAIAIDVLMNHGINPISMIDPAKVAEYWAIPRQMQYTLEESIKQFMNVFNVPSKEKSKISKVVTQIYKKI